MIGFLKFIIILAGVGLVWWITKPVKFTTKPDGTPVAKPRVFGIVTEVIFIIAAIVITSGFGTVKEGFEGVVVRFDRATGEVKHPGLYWITPMVFKIVAIDTRIQEDEMQIAAATSTQQDVTMNVSYNYRINPAFVVALYSEYQRDYSSVLAKAIEHWAKDSSGHFTPAEMLQNRAGLSEEMMLSLNDREKAPQLLPFEIVAMNVSNLTFSTEYTQAIEAKQKAEQEALKAANDLERVKMEAQQQIENARAEAEKIRIQAEAITSQGGSEYVMLQMIQRWNGALPVNWIGSAQGGGPFQIFDTTSFLRGGN